MAVNPLLARCLLGEGLGRGREAGCGKGGGRGWRRGCGTAWPTACMVILCLGVFLLFFLFLCFVLHNVVLFNLFVSIFPDNILSHYYDYFSIYIFHFLSRVLTHITHLHLLRTCRTSLERFLNQLRRNSYSKLSTLEQCRESEVLLYNY